MLSGKRFKMDRPTLAIEDLGGKREAVTVPSGAIVKVISGPTLGDRMIDVLWDSRVVSMFAIDVSVRGNEVRDVSA